MKLNNFFSESPQWHEKVGSIHALLERVKMSEEQSGDVLRLRKLNRILSIHASTAIEGNKLTLEQVTDVINGKPVWGPAKDIKEIQNAWEAYGEMGGFSPWLVQDLLKAHASLTQTLIGESGRFRSVGVSVVRSDGVIMHQGSPPKKVPTLVKQLLKWGESSEAHPLIKSSAVHYMIEHIHPFRDGNGRIGRLWQTLILSKWNPLFAWMPIETLVHYNQALYYKALQESHRDGVDCRPFIDFMLGVIENSLYKYVDLATETMTTKGRGRKAIADVTVNGPVSVTVNALQQKVLILLRANPRSTSQKIAHTLGVTDRTIKRSLKTLREAGVIKRVGSDKTGHWEII